MSQQSQQLNKSQISNNIISYNINQRLQIGKILTKDIFQSFEQQLKANNLLLNITQYNSIKTKSLYEQCIAYYYLKGQAKLSKIKDQQNMLTNNNSSTDINFNMKAKFNVINMNNTSQIINYNKQNKQNIPSLTNYGSIEQSYMQDLMPKAAQMDSIINFHIKLQPHNINQSQLSPNNNEDELLSLNYSKSNNNTTNYQYMYNQSYQIGQQNKNINIISQLKYIQSEQLLNNTKLNESKINKQQSMIINPSKLQSNQSDLLQNAHKQLSFHSSQVQPLQLNQEPINIQQQAHYEKIKQQLYMMRRYRKQNIEQQRLRLDQKNKLKNNHHVINVNQSHTYQYNGQFLSMKNNNTNSNNQIVKQLKHNINNNNKNTQQLSKKRSSIGSISFNSNQSESFTAETLAVRIKNTLNQQQSNPQIKQLQQQINIKKALFNNSNKRQISHLPYISIKDNTKIIQNKKLLEGSRSLRNSINRSKVSNQSTDRGFRSFAQIEQQKRMELTRSKQKVLESCGQSQMSVDLLSPTVNLLTNNKQKCRHSRMMQKYLKKLTQQKRKQSQLFVQKQRKGYNFRKISVPQRYPIQRYYQYDYNSERQQYQNQVSERLSDRKSIILGIDQ